MSAHAFAMTFKFGPAATSQAPGELTVYAVPYDDDKDIYGSSWNGSSWTPWTSMTLLHSGGNNCTRARMNGRPAATVIADQFGKLHHFLCTLDESYKIACAFDNTNVFGDQLEFSDCDENNVYAAEPAVVPDADRLGLTIYAIRSDGALVSQHIQYFFAVGVPLDLRPTGIVQPNLKSPAGDSWNDGAVTQNNLVGRVGNTFWYNQGTGIPGVWVSGPAVVGGSFNGALNIFGEGNDAALWYTRFNPGRGWVSPVWLGGALVGSPSAVSWSPNVVHVFVLGTDFNVYYQWSADRGATFSGWSWLPS